MNFLTVGILAHVDAGKTTLSEGLLYTAGSLRKMGRVDNKDAFLDTYELEKARGITIFSKQALLSWENTQMTLLDTPGHVDFSAEMERTLQVLDYAILVVSGADGVQGHTQTLWRLLDKYQVPVFLFINKMDQPGTEKEKLMRELKYCLSENCMDFSCEKNNVFYENIALCDEDLLEEFLEQGYISMEKIQREITKRNVFPCFFGSALKMTGVFEFLEAMKEYMLPFRPKEEWGAKIFKIARDEQGNRLTYCKITGGTLQARMELIGDGWQEKVNQIRLYSGEKYDAIPEAQAGMICALTGLSHTRPGEGLGVEMATGKPILEPVLTYRIELPEGWEVATFLPKLRMLEEEEPELHVVWDEKLQEIQIQVMGEVQIEILQSLLEERFGAKVTFGTGNIVYKETIRNTVEGVGHFEPLRHYAEVHLWLEPGDPGSGITVGVDCSEDLLDKNWQRLILTHLLEREHIGVLTGSAITDMRITLVAGKAHLKHTEGGDFRQATYRALRQGLMQAESVLLEPYYEFHLEVPDTMVGRAMTDIERRKGTFEVVQGENGVSVLKGTAPVVTMQDYTREVIAYTKGTGKLFCTPIGYRPCHNPEEVQENIGYDVERDVDNPCGSVFCSHGAGFHVSWEHVKEYMHLPGVEERSQKAEENIEVKKTSAVDDWIGVEEIDAILDRTAYSNRKNEKISHKGISAKRVRSVATPQVGLSKPGKKPIYKEKYLLVDGYNIIFAWKELKELSKVSIDSARGRLMDILCDYQGFRKCEVILVFDAYRVQNHKTEILDYHNIHVVYTKEAETADQYIEKFAHENSKKYQITVATSDGLEQIIIRGEGCRLLSAMDLQREVQRTKEEISECISELKSD